MSHFLEPLYGTKHRSFVIGKTPSTQGIVYGPTLFQGDNPPDPLTDSLSQACNNGDLWIQTGLSPSISQYIANAWTALATEVFVANAINGFVQIAGSLAANSIATAVSGLVQDADSLIADSLANAVSGLVQYADTHIVNAVANAMSGLVQVADTVVANAVANASGGLASTAYVDGQITTAVSTVAAGFAALRNPAILNVSITTGAGPADGSLLAPYLRIQDAVYAAEAGGDGTVVICIAPGRYPEDIIITRPQTFLSGLAGGAEAVQIVGSLTITKETVKYVLR